MEGYTEYSGQGGTGDFALVGGRADNATVELLEPTFVPHDEDDRWTNRNFDNGLGEWNWNPSCGADSYSFYNETAGTYTFTRRKQNTTYSYDWGYDVHPRSGLAMPECENLTYINCFNFSLYDSYWINDAFRDGVQRRYNETEGLDDAMSEPGIKYEEVKRMT